MSYTTYEILKEADLQYIPQMALIVYACRNSYYLESHPVDDKGRMGAGSPLSKECISMIANSFSKEHSIVPHGIIPENMFFADSRLGYQKYVWYNPPRKRKMYFSKSLGIEDREYHVPGIVYAVQGERLYLYAFKGQKPKDKLLNAPFFNTTNGSVCLGNSKIGYPSNPTFQDIINYWEKKFWLTEFSHLGGTMNPTKNNLVIVTKQSTEKFNYNELLPISITLKDLLK